MALKLADVILCDQIIKEEKTQKLSLIGLFNILYVDKLPSPIFRGFSVFLRISGSVPGQEMPIKIIISTPQGHEIASAQGSFTPTGTAADLMFNFPPIAVDTYGTHQVKASSGDVFLGYMDFDVKQRPAG